MNELEFVFKKIIEIENRTAQVKSDTEKQVAEKELTFSKKIRNLDNERKEDLKTELEKKHALSVKKHKNFAQELLKESDERCEDINKKYNTIKNEINEKLVSDIIEQN